MQKKIYYAINILVGVLAIVFMCQYMAYGLQILQNQRLIYPWVFAAILAIIAVQSLKALRMYLIIMELPISGLRFMKTYTKSSFILLLFPYKLGEVFRAYCYGADTNKYAFGIISVLVDRFFDSVPLMAFLLFYMLFFNGVLSFMTMVIFAFIILSAFFYFAFPSTKTYLNRFLLTKVERPASINLLGFLGTLDKLYQYCVLLIRGRTPLLMLLSVFVWVAECASLFCISKMLLINFKIQDFMQYLNSVFSGSTGTLSSMYTIISMFLMAALAIIIYAAIYAKGAKRN